MFNLRYLLFSILMTIGTWATFEETINEACSCDVEVEKLEHSMTCVGKTSVWQQLSELLQELID